MQENDVLKLADGALSQEPQSAPMTSFQIEHFVLGVQPTVWGKYRQACLEIRSRKETYESLTERIQLAELELESLRSGAPWPMRLFDLLCGRAVIKRKMRAYSARLKEKEIGALKDNQKSVAEELRTFCAMAETFKAQLPEGVTWEDHQPEYWLSKLWNETVCSLVSSGNVPRDVIFYAFQLPAPQQQLFMSRLRANSIAINAPPQYNALPGGAERTK